MLNAYNYTYQIRLNIRMSIEKYIQMQFFEKSTTECVRINNKRLQ